MRGGRRRALTIRVARPWRQTLGLLLLAVLLASFLLAAVTWAVAQQLAHVSLQLKLVSTALAGLVPVLGATVAGTFVALVRERSGRRAEVGREMQRSFRYWRGRGGPRVGDVGAYELGVHEAAQVVAGLDSTSPPAYVGRTTDEELERALHSEPLVLLVGPSTAGKSRGAFEAMQRCFSGRLLLMPSHCRAWTSWVSGCPTA